MAKLEFTCRAITLSTMALASLPRFRSFDRSKSLHQSRSSSSERASVFKSAVADRARKPSAAWPPCLAITPCAHEVALFSCPRPKQLATPSIHSPLPLSLSALHRDVHHCCHAITTAQRRLHRIISQSNTLIAPQHSALRVSSTRATVRAMVSHENARHRHVLLARAPPSSGSMRLAFSRTPLAFLFCVLASPYDLVAHTTTVLTLPQQAHRNNVAAAVACTRPSSPATRA
jgi:hypothetical protein